MNIFTEIVLKGDTLEYIKYLNDIENPNKINLDSLILFIGDMIYNQRKDMIVVTKLFLIDNNIHLNTVIDYENKFYYAICEAEWRDPEGRENIEILYLLDLDVSREALIQRQRERYSDVFEFFSIYENFTKPDRFLRNGKKF